MITIRINTGNAAFDGNIWGEVKRILSTIEEMNDDQLLIDINGNKVGEVNIGEDN